MFEASATSPAVQQSAIEQQKKILEAVVTGKGWENLIADMRKRVDTPLYRSFLMFDPAAVSSTRVSRCSSCSPCSIAKFLRTTASSSRSSPDRGQRAKPTEFVQLTGVNHLLARVGHRRCRRIWNVDPTHDQPRSDPRADIVARPRRSRRQTCEIDVDSRTADDPTANGVTFRVARGRGENHRPLHRARSSSSKPRSCRDCTVSSPQRADRCR